MATFDQAKGLVKGLFWGGLIGAIIGILYITKRNKGTWEDIGRSADELVDKTKEQLEQARMKMEELVHRGQDSPAGETESLKEAGAPQA
ncbi:MAG: YtxH domain-containing protein [Deltaproteobacteria bacterium]|nr:YtxH domain-containing protein [Deltaproteobacteria bacterium]